KMKRWANCGSVIITNTSSVIVNPINAYQHTSSTILQNGRTINSINHEQRRCHIPTNSKEPEVDAGVSGFGIGGATWFRNSSDFGELWKRMLPVYGEFYSHDFSSFGSGHPASHPASQRAYKGF